MAVLRGSRAMGSDALFSPLQASGMQSGAQTHTRATYHKHDRQTGRQIGRQTDILKHHFKKSFL